MTTPERLVRSTVRVVARVAVVAAAAFALAMLLRHGLVERDDVGSLCESPGAPAWCALRMLVIRGFLLGVYGASSLAFAVLAAWRRSPLFADLAVAVGTVGMVLYDFTWSGAGVVGGMLVRAALERERDQNARPERDGGSAPRE
jgi:hypothetical protein